MRNHMGLKIFLSQTKDYLMISCRENKKSNITLSLANVRPVKTLKEGFWRNSLGIKSKEKREPPIQSIYLLGRLFHLFSPADCLIFKHLSKNGFSKTSFPHFA